MTDAPKPNVLVRYVRNADDSQATQLLKFNDDDRPDLHIGQVGYVTEAEIHRSAVYGVVLETITPEEAADLGLTVPEPAEEPKALSEMSGKELDAIAETESIDLTGKRSNDAKADAIQEARDARNNPEGEASLPATATTGTGTPAAPSTTAGSGPTTSTGTQTGGPAT